MSINKKLEALGYSIQSTLKEDNFDGINGDHKHVVTVGYQGRKMTCEYTSGCAHRHYPAYHKRTHETIQFSYGRITLHELAKRKRSVPNAPALEDVLYSLLMDAEAGRNTASFGEFCDDYGYDEDSRRALKIFNACLEQHTKLRRLGVDFESLDVLFEDF